MLAANARQKDGEDGFQTPPRSRRNHHRNVLPAADDGGAITKVESCGFSPSPRPSSNLDRFLHSTTPSVTAQYLSKTTIRGWRTCDVVYKPYFVLGDLWEAFKEWSAYGTGVPLVLNRRDRVVQYYVPYLSGIQLYGESTRKHWNHRNPCEESDGDSYRDSSSESSSDCELERGFKSSSHEGFSSDDSASGSVHGRLPFEYFERDAPYNREPLADKMSALASSFPELKTLRSCDLSPPSWMSVAWYPIYHIPVGPTSRDLDTCFLTFHTLSTPDGGTDDSLGPAITYPDGYEDAPMISLPIFGLAPYKFKGLIWTADGGRDRQLARSLLEAANKWLRLLHVNHPDYKFFVSHGGCVLAMDE